MGASPSQFKGTDNPVDTVSWDDAVDFCRRLSELPAEKAAGNVSRLPTEAEWGPKESSGVPTGEANTPSIQRPLCPGSRGGVPSHVY